MSMQVPCAGGQQVLQVSESFQSVTGNEDDHRLMKTQNIIESKRGVVQERKGGKKESRVSDYTPKKRTIDETNNTEDENTLNPSKRKTEVVKVLNFGNK